MKASYNEKNLQNIFVLRSFQVTSSDILFSFLFNSVNNTIDFLHVELVSFGVYDLHIPLGLCKYTNASKGSGTVADVVYVKKKSQLYVFRHDTWMPS
jgi:hypothetical protein